MSGIGHAISKVFKGAVGIVKKVWKPLAIAAAVYFTGGAALGAMGALGAGGSVLGGAASGLEAAAGGLGIGSGAGIGSAFAAGAGTLGDAAVGGMTAAGAGGDLFAGGALEGVTPSAVMTAAPTVGGASSLWGNALGVAKSVLGTPGVPSLIGGLAQGFMASNLQNAQMKWQEEHAPGQIAGGASGAWGGGSFPAGKNLTPGQPQAAPVKLPPLKPYSGQPYQIGQQPMPGVNEPGPYTQYGGQWEGYGTPGYGQQFPPGTQPGGPQPPGLLGGNQQQPMPFMESPYDESYA